MRVYITGIDGMLGRALANYHIAKGDSVRGCDNTTRDDFEYSRVDIRNLDALVNDVGQELDTIDRIYHCAAMLGVENTEKYPVICEQTNIRGTANVVLAADAVDAELVFLSSSEVYGNGQPGELFNEVTSPLLGNNVYARSKAYGEEICLGSPNRRVIVCRMFNCYGPYQVRQFFLPKAVEKALTNQVIHLYGNADNVRSYLFSIDAAKMIYDVACNAPDRSVVNVAHDQIITLREAVQLVEKAIHQPVSMTVVTEAYDDRAIERDVPNRLADRTLLNKFTELKRPTRVEYGIKGLVSLFYTTRPDWSYDRELI